MFLIFGIHTIRRDVKGTAPRREYCAHCGLISDFRPQREQRFLSLFFVPVIPLSRAKVILVCSRCGAPYQTHSAAIGAIPREPVLVCPVCKGAVPVPAKLEGVVRVACPHCGDALTITVNRAERN